MFNVTFRVLFSRAFLWTFLNYILSIWIRNKGGFKPWVKKTS